MKLVRVLRCPLSLVGALTSSSSGGDVGGVAARCAVDLQKELGKDLTCSILNDTGALLGTCSVRVSAVP